jgi:hypothetical protein
MRKATNSSPTQPLRPGQPRHQDHAYRRCGTRNLFVIVEPLAGQRHVVLTKRRTKADFARAVRYLTDILRPMVLDNLNTHSYQAFVETFGILEAKRIMRRVCFHYTPIHASWLHMAEIEIGMLSRQSLRRHIPSAQIRQTDLSAWQDFRNKRFAKILGSFSLKDAPRVFAKHYPEFSPR